MEVALAFSLAVVAFACPLAVVVPLASFAGCPCFCLAVVAVVFALASFGGGEDERKGGAVATFGGGGCPCLPLVVVRGVKREREREGVDLASCGRGRLPWRLL